MNNTNRRLLTRTIYNMCGRPGIRLRPLRHILTAIAAAALAACSSTANLPEGEVLYTGLKPIEYKDAPQSEYFTGVQEELEAALDCAPNGALLGSSYYRTPLPLRLWIYNSYANSQSGFGRWMRRSFGSEPVLMSRVNPGVRELVAGNVLKNSGYFASSVSHKTVSGSNKKKAKIAYTVSTGPLYTVDTLEYKGFPTAIDSLITATAADSRLRRGAPFAVSYLDGERTRISNLLRNSGYYYYRQPYATFTADSVTTPQRIRLTVMPIAGMPEEATHPWHLGRLTVDMRRSVADRPTDSVTFRGLKVCYSGKKPPIRLRALLRDMKLRRGQLYSYSDYLESLNNINSMSLFTLTDFAFTPAKPAVEPADSSALPTDTLDMRLTCVFDKPYDASIEANYAIKSNDRTGPGLVLGLTKRNAFRGGEKLSLKLKGSYEWQTSGRRVGADNGAINSYEYGADLSVEYPRIESPVKRWKRIRFYVPPSTQFGVSANVLNRANFFKMMTISGNVTYKFQTSKTSRHEFSPLLLDYNFLSHSTAAFDSIVETNPAIYVSMKSQFVPKIKYTYTYTSPATCANPIQWETTLTEAGNLLSLAYMAFGKKFNDKQKNLFGNPFAQFVKVNTSLRKTWTLAPKRQLVGRVAAGLLWAYGNSERAPYAEQFYVGGANSIRAFTIRSIGPGKYVSPAAKYSYLDQTGDIKLEMNLEYRFPIFGSLYGAMFLDAGNVWLLRKDEARPDADFRPGNFFKQIATGTGAGIRYDLDFFVIRLDLGVALHVPYDTGKGGYYNIPKFRDGLGLHFAIGYPF